MMQRFLQKTVAVIVVLVTLQACESWMRNPLTDKETGEDIKLLVVDFNFIQTKLAFHLKDILTDQYIEGSEVELKFIGEDAEHLITFAGTKPDQFLTSTGFLQVGVDPNIPITSEDPLNISVVAIGERYVSAPMALSYTTTGLKDVLLRVTRIGDKSGSTGAFSEPFDLIFNGETQSADLSYLGDIRSAETGTAYSYLNMYQNLVAGELLANNLSDPLLYDDYGVYYAWGDEILSPPELPVRQVNLNSGALVYSSVLKTGIEKCSQGLTIQINSSDGTAGSGSFAYQLTFSDGSAREGIVSGTFPIEVLIDDIYYPAGNPAVTVTVEEDSQYTISGAAELSTACGELARFTATPKTNLQAYKWIVRYSCPDLQASFALSIGGEFKIADSEEEWTRFQFVEGVAILQLVRNEQYHFRINIDGEVYEYELPTDPNELDTFIRDNQSEDFYLIETLTISEADALVTVEADVQLAGDVCDILN